MSFLRSMLGARRSAAASAAAPTATDTQTCIGAPPPTSLPATAAAATSEAASAAEREQAAGPASQAQSSESAGVFGMFAGLSLKADTPPRPPQASASPAAAAAAAADDTAREHSSPEQSGYLLSMLNSMPVDNPEVAGPLSEPPPAISASQSAFSFLRSDPEPPQPADAPSVDGSVLSPESDVSSFGFLSQKSAPPLSSADEDQHPQELPHIQESVAEVPTAKEPSELEEPIVGDIDSHSTRADQSAHQPATDADSHELSEVENLWDSLMAKPTTASRSQSAPSPSDFISLESMSGSRARTPSPAEPVRSQSDKILEEPAPEQAPAVTEQEIVSPDVSPVSARFKSLQQQFGEFMLQHWGVLREFSAQKAAILSNIGKTADHISLLSSEVSLLEAQQGRAVESEQYELADELDSELKQKRQEVEALENTIKELSISFDDCDSSVQDQSESFRNRSEQFIADLEQFQEHSMHSMREYVKEQQEQIEKEDSRLSEEISRFERIMSIISTDLDRVEAEHADIDRSVRERTQAEHDEKDKLLQAQHNLEQELQQLRQLVAEKEASLNKMLASLSEAESKIELARTSYSRQLHRLSERRERVLNEKSEMELERSETEAKKSALDKTKQEVQHHEQHVEEVCAEVSKRVEATRCMVSSLCSYESEWLGWFKQERNLHELVECASGKVAQETRSIQALRTRQNLLRQGMSSNKDNIESVKRQLPDLQAQKKDAVASRDFKAASKISKQIKALQVSMEQSQVSLEDGETLLAALAKDIDASEAELDKCQQGQREAQTQLDQHHFNVCLNRRSKLRQLLVWATPVETKALLEDIEQVESEAAALGQQYGWAVPSTEDGEEYQPTHEVDVQEHLSQSESGSERVCVDAQLSEQAQHSAVDDSNGDGLVLQIRAIEEELEAAIEAEDFDLAESLHERITMLQNRYDASVLGGDADGAGAQPQSSCRELLSDAESATSESPSGADGQETALSTAMVSTEQEGSTEQQDDLSESEVKIDPGQLHNNSSTGAQKAAVASPDEERDDETEETQPVGVLSQSPDRDDDGLGKPQLFLAPHHDRDSLDSDSQSEHECGADHERYEHQDGKETGIALDTSLGQVADASSLDE